MTSSEIQTIAAEAMPQLESLLQKILPDGRLTGHEYSCADLSGGAGESCKTNIVTGKWSDFATGEAGGDPVSLLAAIRKCTQSEAAGELASIIGHTVTSIEHKKFVKKEIWTPIIPIPADAPPPPSKHYQHGEPVKIHEYRDREGLSSQIVHRYEFPPDTPGEKNKKQFSPVTFCQNESGRTEWRFQSLPENRPLYGLELLNDTDIFILIVEGEKACDAARRILGNSIPVLTWSGGSNAVHKTIWAPVNGLRLCIWPDADVPGEKAALTVAEAAMDAGAESIKIVVLPANVCEGFDLADAENLGWTREKVMQFLKTSVSPEKFRKLNESVTVTTSNITPTSGDEWSNPIPLPEGLPPVKSLEPGMIPVPLRGWLMDIADRMQIPPDFSTAAAVVALGSIVGRGCGIHPKRHDDWLVVPNLWGAVVGRPSLMKTPAITEAQKHLVRLETEAHLQYLAAEHDSEIDREITKITKAAIADEIKKAVKARNNLAIEVARVRLSELQDSEPTRRRYQTQDGTTEKIGELLNQNSRGILINRDELVGWFHSLDKTGREGDRAFYLESWNGTGAYTYDRIGRGTLDIEALCVSIFGAITPGPLSDYVYQASKGGNGDDGLLQRFQVTVWPDTPNEWRNVDRYPDTTEKSRVWEIFNALSGGIPGAVKEEGANIPALRFSSAGQEIFDAWRHELETRLRSDHGLPPSIESHLAKYRSLMPSLALVFHLVDVADGNTAPGLVSEKSALMATEWCAYLESHAGRVYGGTVLPGMESAREITKHIKRGAIQDGMTIRELWRPQWSRLSNSDEVKAGLEVLTDYGWVTVDKISTGGRPSETIRLNPRLLL